MTTYTDRDGYEWGTSGPPIPACAGCQERPGYWHCTELGQAVCSDCFERLVYHRPTKPDPRLAQRIRDSRPAPMTAAERSALRTLIGTRRTTTK